MDKDFDKMDYNDYGSYDNYKENDNYESYIGADEEDDKKSNGIIRGFLEFFGFDIGKKNKAKKKKEKTYASSGNDDKYSSSSYDSSYYYDDDDESLSRGSKDSLSYTRQHVDIVSFVPSDFSQVKVMMQEAKKGKIVMFDTSGVSVEESRNIVNYISGLADGLDYKLQRPYVGIFCIVPDYVSLMMPDEAARLSSKSYGSSKYGTRR